MDENVTDYYIKEKKYVWDRYRDNIKRRVATPSFGIMELFEICLLKTK
jgi:hypothetical protein